MSEYLDVACETVRQAVSCGANHAECTISEGEEFSANIRLGEIETLKQAGSRGIGLRILINKHAGASYSSDFSSEGLRKLVDSAIELAQVTTEDPFAGIPESADLGSLPGDLQLFDPGVANLDPDVKIDFAKRAEAAALATDERINNSEGASFDSSLSRRAFANSRGFSGEYRSSYCSVSAVPVAKDGDSMERDYWYSIARNLEKLESPEYVGRTAAERTVRRLGAVKVETQRVPVIFEPRVARSLLENLFEAVDGRSIYRQSSFLAGKLGEQIAATCLNIIDDGTIPGLFGTSPFDDEGVATRRTSVIRNGVLTSYLLNTYAARKLGMTSTGNASRGITGNAGIGHGNLYVDKGTRTPAELIASVRNGFYVTELIGSGVNVATGDYSRGAAGLWIRNGELAFPVSEVTVAGTLQQILLNLEPASDLEFRGSVAAPTILIQEMTVGGR